MDKPFLCFNFFLNKLLTHDQIKCMSKDTKLYKK